MPNNMTSLDNKIAEAKTTPRIINFDRLSVSIGLKGGSDGKYDSALHDMPNIQVESVTLTEGPAPATATLLFPVPIETTGRIIYDHLLTTTSAKATTPFSPIDAPEVSGHAKVEITKTDANSVSGTKSTELIFIGYITKITEVKDPSGGFVRVFCQDVRYLMQKAPIQGVLHWNAYRQEVVWIRDAEPIFNEGNRPNRKVTKSSDYENFPVFIASDWNRGYKDPDKNRDRQYIPDNKIDAAISGGLINTEIVGAEVGIVKDGSVAKKWRPGHVWNYLSNIFSRKCMYEGTKIYNVPTSLTINEWPSSLMDEVDITKVHPSDSNTPEAERNSVGDEFFKARGIVGDVNQAGLGSEISGIGEYNPNGTSVINSLYSLCRSIGNFSVNVKYNAGDSDNGSRTQLIPYRTTSAHGDTDGLAIGDGGAVVNLQMPVSDDAENLPNITKYSLTSDYKDNYTIAHIKGGSRFIQLTFCTMGKTAYTDPLGKYHPVYQPAIGWKPELDVPTLISGWTKEQQILWCAQSDYNNPSWRYPDVFRTWIIRPDIDLVAMCGDLTIGEPPNAQPMPGFRRYFEKNRHLLPQLISSTFEHANGLWRSCRTKYPVQVWRAFRGVRTTIDGSTMYGDDTTEVTEAQPDQGPVDYNDIWRVEPEFQLFSEDNRMGIRFGTEARYKKDFKWQDPLAEEPPKTGPWSWNGVYQDPFAFELFITVAVEVDEDLFDWKAMSNDALNVDTFGPRMELYRSADVNYKQESTHNSMIELNFSGTQNFTNDPRAGDIATYNDGGQELGRRANMMLNRHGKYNFEGEFSLYYLDTSMKPGMVLSGLKLKDKGDKITEMMIVSSVTLDARHNITTVKTATIR